MHFWLNPDTRYNRLSENQRTKYLLRADNKVTSKIKGKYINLMVQTREEILNSQM